MESILHKNEQYPSIFQLQQLMASTSNPQLTLPVSGGCVLNRSHVPVAESPILGSANLHKVMSLNVSYPKI